MGTPVAAGTVRGLPRALTAESNWGRSDVRVSSRSVPTWLNPIRRRPYAMYVRADHDVRCVLNKGMERYLSIPLLNCIQLTAFTKPTSNETFGAFEQELT